MNVEEIINKPLTMWPNADGFGNLTESKDWEMFLAKVTEEIKAGEVWYGRFPYFEDRLHSAGMWLIMDIAEPLPDHWEYRKHGSNIIFRKEQDPEADYANITKKMKESESSRILMAMKDSFKEETELVHVNKPVDVRRVK